MVMWPTLACCAGAAFAAPGDEVVEEIVVTAAPLARASDELTQPTAVLGDEELLRKTQQSIGETLAGELGVSSSYFGPVAGRPVIRGQAGPRVSVLEHGVGALDVSDISPDHAVAVEPLLAEQIEIIRGPSTLLYGSSATGGVVNVVDGRIHESLPESRVGGAFELRGDTAAEEQSGVGRLDGRLGPVAWHLDGFHRETNDVEIRGYATDDPQERPDDEKKGRLVNSFGESQGYAAGGSFVADDGFFGISYSAYQNDYGLPGPEEEEGGGEEEGSFVADGPFIELDQARVDLRGAYRFDGPIESVRLRAGRNDYEHEEIESTGEVATQFENDAWESRVEVVHAPLGAWRGALGVQLGDREFSAVGDEAFLPETTTRSQGVFLIEERELGAGRLELGARFETVEHDPDGGLPDYDEDAFSLAGGAVWDFAPDFDLAINVARSERHPASEELYSNGPHLATGLFEIGLLAEGGTVTQELSHNVDVAVHHHSDTVSWQASVFYNDVEDYVFLATTDAIEDGLPVAVYTQADAEFYGYEAELELALPRDLALRLFTDYVRGKTGDDDLPRIQPMRVGAELGFVSGRWSANVGAIWHAEQDDVSSYETEAFTLVTADVVYDFATTEAATWQLFVRGSNLLDEEARRSTSFRAAYVPMPGVSVLGGVRMLFNR
jgi:iron complex outermembrane receptor protein